MKDYVIIVAGGKGARMGGDIPKQFLPVGGRPVLMRTLERFREYSESLNIILVLPELQQEYWKNLCQQYHFDVPHQLTGGGETRFHSVQNGLQLIPDGEQGVVGIHDGVRPFPSIEVIARCFEMARETGAAIPVVPVIETLRKIMGNQCCPPITELAASASHTVCRSEYRLVQTPQAFDIRLLKAANKQPYSEEFTDDASVVEHYGHSITLVDGNRENIKITTPFDLVMAEAIAANSRFSDRQLDSL